MKLKTFSICFLIMLVTACATTDFSTRVVNMPNQKWRIGNIAVMKVDQGWEISGYLHGPNSADLPNGTVRISIFFEDGRVFSKQLVTYTRLHRTSRWRRHDNGRALFMKIYETLPANSLIIAEHIVED